MTLTEVERAEQMTSKELAERLCPIGVIVHKDDAAYIYEAVHRLSAVEANKPGGQFESPGKAALFLWECGLQAQLSMDKTCWYVTAQQKSNAWIIHVANALKLSPTTSGEEPNT